MQEETPNPPMSSPAPFLLGIAIGAVLLLGALAMTDFMWRMSGPETVVTASEPAPPQARLEQQLPDTPVEPAPVDTTRPGG